MQVERHQQTMRCLAGRLVTWYVHQGRSADYSECNPVVAKSIDLVATLGGDGTLLWACKTMGARSVPPVIPYAFGSLGFMTPFASSSISQVLEVRQLLPALLRILVHLLFLLVYSRHVLRWHRKRGTGLQCR